MISIAIIGYGKMGKAIEKIALKKGFKIASIIHRTSEIDALPHVDVAIEFSTPETAFENIHKLINRGIPTVCGTTGWLDQLTEIEQLTKDKNTAFFYASNFSLGVNLFFELNAKLAQLMVSFEAYKPSITEIHHIHKKDAPSGTALTLSQGILQSYPQLNDWSLSAEANKLPIHALREGEVPGTHIITYKSETDVIEIKHEAFSREGFAQGAVWAAEWLIGKKGIFGMKDLINL